MTGTCDTPVGPVPCVATRLSAADVLGGWRVRWGSARYRYKIPPGLYAVGDPDDDSPVLATANYKLTFDAVRRELHGIDAWLLVVDTRGINVWCAAGKGTFSAPEVTYRAQRTGLHHVVTHRTLVLPQLAAPGVAAHEVRLATGFHVVYGPVRAADLPAFLAADLKATPEMRRVTFTLAERTVLFPVELVNALKPALVVAVVLAALGTIADGATLAAAFGPTASLATASVAAGVIGGAVVTPLLLPWLPGRAFSAKGALAGLLLASLAIAVSGAWTWTAAAAILTAVTLAAYVAMNFTGSTPFTSLSGVDAEMRRAIPLQALGAVVALAIWIVAAFVGGAS